MADETTSIASPLSVLLEEADHGAREVLLLTFTLNLAFWERFALGAARGLGARVTTVSDVHMTSADIGHVRYAGLTYLDGRAACRNGGAFHPKLLVVAGEERVAVVLGSGNATIPGWHGNAELWTVLRGDTDGAPIAFVQLGEWLQRLPERVDFSHGVERALGDVGTLLSALPTLNRGPRLVSSLDQPILEQLPSGPVDELLVAAPFHDPSEQALDALVGRMQPARFQILVQPDKGVFDGKALLASLDKRGSIASIGPDRYYHGKLYEWVVGERWQDLTGSPNLSAAGLLRSMAQGGNCELGLLADVDGSLAPTIGESLGHDLADHDYDHREETRYAIVLLGATVLNDTVVLALQHPLAEEGTIQVAEAGEWTTLMPFPGGKTRHVVPQLAVAGGAVRVSVGDIVSNTVFVLDSSRVLRVRVAHEGRVLTNEQEVFEDPAIAQAFIEDVYALRFYLPGSDRRGIVGHGENHEGDRDRVNSGPIEFQSWEEYLDVCAGRVGQRLLDFAFGLPWLGLTSEGGRQEEMSSLAEVEDEPDLQPADIEEHEELPDFRCSSAYRRRRYQRWCEQLADISSTLVPAGRLIVLRLVLRAGAGGLWLSHAQWMPVLETATAALAAPTQTFREERAAMSSLAMIGLAVLRGEVQSFATWSLEKSRYERTRAAVFELLANVDLEMVGRYVRELVPILGSHLEPASILALRDDLVEEDTMGVAVSICARELGIEAARDGNLIRLIGTQSGDPRWILLRVVGLAEEAPIVGACARSDRGGETLVVWKRPHLVIARTTVNGTSGQWYVVGSHQSPRVLAASHEMTGELAWWPYGQRPPEEVRALLAELGLPSDLRSWFRLSSS